MRRYRVWLAASLWLLAGPAWSARLEVVLTSQRAQPPAPGALEIVLRQDGAAEATPITRRVEANGAPEVFHLAPGSWSVSTQAPGVWALPKSAVLGHEETRRIELELYDAATVRGRVEVETGDVLPAELGLELYKPISLPGPENPRPGRDPRSGAIVFRCSVIAGAFDCPAPAGEWDVRLRAANHISHYFWRFRVQPEAPASFGTLKLRLGASVVGWTRVEGAIPKDSGPCQLTLQPMQAGPSAQAETTARALSLTAIADERGFFHFAGVPPGAYVLTGELRGFAPAKFFPLRVVENRESQLEAPLVLRPPLRLEIRVDPAADLQQKAWRVEVSDLGDTPGAMEKVAEGAVGPDGTWSTTALSPGRFVVDLRDAAGSPWDSREIDLTDDSTEVFALDLVEVEGSLRLGGKPLAATLYFGRKTGIPRFTFRSDEEGRFTGFMAREGTWRVQIESPSPRVQRSLAAVSVRRSPGKKVARVTIDLPGGHLQGKVVDEQDHPAPQAHVYLMMAGDTPDWIEAGPDGEFDAYGFGSGPAFVQARGRDMESEGLWLALDEKASPQPLRLVLQKKREVAGWILSPNLEGIPGAQVFASAPGEIHAQAVTDRSGRFSLRIPAAAPALDLVVLPPGYSLLAQTLSLDPGGDLRLFVPPQGGTLLLKGLDKVDAAEGAPKEVVLATQNGVVILLDLLRNWALANGVPQTAPDLRIFPQLAAGQYQVCRVPFGQAASWLQGNRSLGRCATGNLNEGGELVLELPSP